MKIGVDAVLLGCWAGQGDPHRILDIGTGCGVIAMILAQRFPAAIVNAIDSHKDSVEEAGENFKNSPWPARLTADHKTFPGCVDDFDVKYDLIVSNPPYFNAGIDNPLTPREIARHQGTLSVFSLLEKSISMLSPEGRISMIYPSDCHADLLQKADKCGWQIVRECKIRNNPSRPIKRIMSEFCRKDDFKLHSEESSQLILFENGEPTSDYKKLCHDFYLKF